MKKFLSLIFLLSALSLGAQTTTITATVVDTDGTTWAGGTWKISFIPNGAIQNMASYNQNGVKLVNSTAFQNGTMDNSGNLSLSIYDSSTVTPLGSSWSLTICPKASAPCGIYNFSSAGPSMNISSALTFLIPAPRFTAVAGTYGYADVEAIPAATPGSTYYSVSSQCQRYYNDLTLTWACVSAAGGGFLPLTGGILSGSLGGTAGAFSGDLQIGGNIIAPGTNAVQVIGGSTSSAFVVRNHGNTSSYMIIDSAGNFNFATGTVISSNYFQGSGFITSGCATGTYQQANTPGCSAPVGAIPSITNTSSATGAIVFAGGGVSQTGNTFTFTAGTPTLPNAVNTFNDLQTNSTGVSSVRTSAVGGTWEAVQHGGASNTNGADASTILNTQIATACASTTSTRIHLAAGTYNVNSGLLMSATSSTCRNLVIEGDGPNTILQSTCSGNPYVMWYNNTTVTGEHFNGPTFRHLQIKNNGGTACAIGIQLTQTAGFQIQDVLVTGFAGQTYSTGTISTSGNAVTGAGTTFTSKMVHGFIEITNGSVTTRGEVCAFNSATSLTLCSTAFPTGNIAGGTSYALAYGGDGIVLDPGASYTQYGTILDSYEPGNLIGIHAWGTSAAASGISRISIIGDRSYISPNPSTRITDAVGIFLGKKSDTITVGGAVNNVATCFVLESAHANRIQGKCEDNSTYAPVTTCNGGVASQSCTQAVEASSDAVGNGGANTYNIYAYLVGTVYRFDNAAGVNNGFIGWDQTFVGQYLTHFDFYGSGCPGNGSGILIGINTYDCNHTLVTQTVN